MQQPDQPNPVASAGKIHLLDVASLKTRLGSKWERMEEHVQLFFETAIRRSLKPGDTFTRHGELNYLVLFRELSAPEAELKCAAISEEVCKRLFGANGEQVAMRNLVAHVGLSSIPTRADENASLDRHLEQHGKEIVVRHQPGGATEDKDPTARSVRLKTGSDTPARSRVALSDIGYVYRPIWDSINHVVLTYLCQPRLAAHSPANSAGFWEAEDEDDQTLLDLYVLRECLEHSRRLRTAGLRVVLAIPVHFSTIARARSWRDYSGTLKAIDEEIRRDLVSFVFGIDYGVPHIRLAQEFPKLSRMAHRVFGVIGRAQGAGARFAKTGAHGFGFVLDETEDEAQSVLRLRELAKEAQSATIDSFVLGLRSTSLALASIHAGIRYLEGSIVRPAVTDPRHGFVHDVEDLYKGKRVVAGA